MGLAVRKNLRIFFFGDSICFGQGVSPQHIWVCRIAAALEARFQERIDILVQNPSVNGNTTRQALERIAYDLQSHAPQIVLTQFGMNDCNGWETDRGRPRVSREGFRANVAEIVDRARVFGAKHIIVGTNHPTTRTSELLPNVDFTYESANRSYNEVSREVAASKSAVLADAEQAFHKAVETGRAHYADLLLDDQLHLSKAGHDVYFESRLPLLIDAVEIVSPQI